MQEKNKCNKLIICRYFSVTKMHAKFKQVIHILQVVIKRKLYKNETYQECMYIVNNSCLRG